MAALDPLRTLAPVLARLPGPIRGPARALLGSPVEDRVVLLVDDVITTGGTVNEAARALLAAGAKEVVVGAVARA
jgi:predicted amidophosphoribosyltransferase